MFSNTQIDYDVDKEFLSPGPIAATATPDGKFIFIDFLDLNDQSKALRLGIPADKIETIQGALHQFQEALENPLSGIHYQEPH